MYISRSLHWGAAPLPAGKSTGTEGALEGPGSAQEEYTCAGLPAIREERDLS